MCLGNDLCLRSLATVAHCQPSRSGTLAGFEIRVFKMLVGVQSNKEAARFLDMISSISPDILALSFNTEMDPHHDASSPPISFHMPPDHQISL